VARQVGVLCVSLGAVFLLLQVIIPAMTLRPHSVRLEVAIVQQQLHLLCASPLQIHSAGEFVLQHVLNCDRLA
jgi:hypothetical protein